MEKAYRHISFLFLALLLISIAGFWKTYLIRFPAFDGLVTAHHLHGFIMLLWLGLLIAQPLLIRAKNIELHRILGKASYILMPLMVFSMLAVTWVQYQRGMTQHLPRRQTDYGLYMFLVDLVPFVTLYLLAMWHRHKPAVHMRYIIACSVIFFNPALGRINAIAFGMTQELAVVLSYVYCDAILLGFLLYDLKNHKPYRIYLYSLIFLVVCHSSLLYAPFSEGWHTLTTDVAKLSF